MKTRNYGIDLLRIISMFMVVSLHVLLVSGVLESDSQSLAFEMAWLIECACYGAVNCYALISGFVGVHSKFKYTNIVYLWLQVVALTVVLQAVLYVVEPGSFSFGKTIMCFLPVFGRTYWYFTDYVLLFFFIPLLNMAVQHVPKLLLRNMLIILAVLFSASIVFPLPGLAANPFNLESGYSALWLILLYLIGAYIAKYAPFSNIKKRVLLGAYVLCTFITWASKLILTEFSPIIGSLAPPNTFINYLSPFLLIGSVSLLLLFSRISDLPKPILGIVKFASPLCFGVYITHLHPLIWNCMKEWSNYAATYSAPVFIALAFGIGVAVFVLSMCIDKVRYCIFSWFRIKEGLLKLEHKLLTTNTD